jgi:uncharacterized protein
VHPEALTKRTANVLVGSQDRDFITQIGNLDDSGHEVAILGFFELMSGVYAELGVPTYDLGFDAKAFDLRLPHIA